MEGERGGTNLEDNIIRDKLTPYFQVELRGVIGKSVLGEEQEQEGFD